MPIIPHWFNFEVFLCLSSYQYFFKKIMNFYIVVLQFYQEQFSGNPSFFSIKYFQFPYKLIYQLLCLLLYQYNFLLKLSILKCFFLSIQFYQKYFHVCFILSENVCISSFLLQLIQKCFNSTNLSVLLSMKVIKFKAVLYIILVLLKCFPY